MALFNQQTARLLLVILLLELTASWEVVVESKINLKCLCRLGRLNVLFKEIL